MNFKVFFATILLFIGFTCSRKEPCIPCEAIILKVNKTNEYITVTYTCEDQEHVNYYLIKDLE